MSHAVAKPKTAEGGVVQVVIGPTSGGQNNFTISVSSASLSFAVQVADVTADDDTNAVFTHNQMTRGQFQVQGYALGDAEHIGIYKLQSLDNGRAPAAVNDTVNGTTQKFDIQFNWASGKAIYGIAIIEQIQLSYSRSSPFVGVAMSGRFTSTDLGQQKVADGAYQGV
tara:strand:- start:342 stop:845 length:504 start_codon:yes stop_codon:yes gene_type:complete